MASADTCEELLRCLDGLVDQVLVELGWFENADGEIVPGVLIPAGGPLGLDEPESLHGEDKVLAWLNVLFGADELVHAG